MGAQSVDKEKGLLSRILNIVQCVGGDSNEINKEASRLKETDQASDYNLFYNPQDNDCLVTTAKNFPGISKTAYNFHALKYLLNGKVVEKKGANKIDRYSEKYLEILNKLIANKVGGPVTILSFGCGRAEVMRGSFDLHVPPDQFKYYDVAIENSGKGAITIDVVPVPYSETRHKKTVDAVERAEKFYRANFEKLMLTLADDLSDESRAWLFPAVKDAARRFVVHVFPQSDDPTVSGRTFEDKYVDIASGQGYEEVMSKMLHELLHVTFSIADKSKDMEKKRAADRGIHKEGEPTSYRLNESMTEFITRLIISKNSTGLDFERCPCAYWGADVLFTLVKFGFISVDDIVLSYVCNDIGPILDKTDFAHSMPIIAKIFYVSYSDKKDEEQFKEAIAKLERFGIPHDKLRSLFLDEAHRAMIAGNAIKVLDGSKSDDGCPDLVW